MVEYLCAKGVTEGLGIGAVREDAVWILGGKALGDGPGVVGAAVIVYVDVVTPGEFIPQGVFHEVAFVFGETDAVDFHGDADCWSFF
jgi:hypothetical protein